MCAKCGRLIGHPAPIVNRLAGTRWLMETNSPLGGAERDPYKPPRRVRRWEPRYTDGRKHPVISRKLTAGALIEIDLKRGDLPAEGRCPSTRSCLPSTTAHHEAKTGKAREIAAAGIPMRHRQT
jgi:hypothetical protein